MPTHAIYLTVDLPQSEQLQEIRDAFDPLSGMVPPHITVVFPFESEIVTDALITLIDDAIEEEDCLYIEISLAAPVFLKEFCVFPIKEGRDLITSLHDRLYGSMLEPFLSDEYEYVPHLTVGRASDEADQEEIREQTDQINLEQTGSIRGIILERLDTEYTSTTLYERTLRPTGDDD